MSTIVQIRVKGCGKAGHAFTLYHVSIFDGLARALSHGFKNLACGCCVSTFQKMTYGIVLCPDCADHLGFPPLPMAKKESAKASHSNGLRELPIASADLQELIGRGK